MTLEGSGGYQSDTGRDGDEKIRFVTFYEFQGAADTQQRIGASCCKNTHVLSE